MARLDRKELAKIVGLRQSESVWLCSARPMSIPIGEAADRIQPYIVVVMDATEQMARSFDLVPEAQPDAERVSRVLTKAMYAPMDDAPPEAAPMRADLVPMRPQRILVDDVALVEALKPMFAEADVEVNFYGELTPIDQFLQMFDQLAMPKDGRIPFLEIPGIGQPMLAELFDVSAEFFKRDVWDDLDSLEVVRARYPADGGKDYFVSVMGMGGEQFGLAIYESVEDLNATINAEDPDNPLTAMSVTRAMNFSFSDKEGLLKEDLAAFKKYKWAKPERNAFLAPICYSMETGITTPNAEAMALAAALFRTLPKFAYEEMNADSDELTPATKTYGLPAVHGGANIELSYPVEGLEIPDDDGVDFLDLDNNPDLLNRLSALFGGMPDDDAPKLPPTNSGRGGGIWKKRK
jgi:hypothetical protein